MIPTPELELRFNTRWTLSDEGHWIWTGARRGQYGGMGYRNQNFYAHRISYLIHHGPIPDGLVVDHICRVKLCVNPEHLQVLSNGENIRRGGSPAVTSARHASKTHCPQGHEYNQRNTDYYTTKRGYVNRMCRVCRRERRRRAERTD